MSKSFNQTFPLQWSSDGYTSPGPNINLLGNLDGQDGYLVSASFTTVPVYTRSLYSWSVQFSAITGSPSGTVAIQVSNDIGRLTQALGLSDNTVYNWATLYWYDTVSSAWVSSKTVSSDTSIIITNTQPFRWMRLVWTNTSGSFICRAYMQQGGGTA
jgi:hypothetical protein